MARFYLTFSALDFIMAIVTLATKDTKAMLTLAVLEFLGIPGYLFDIYTEANGWWGGVKDENKSGCSKKGAMISMNNLVETVLAIGAIIFVQELDDMCEGIEGLGQTKEECLEENAPVTDAKFYVVGVAEMCLAVSGVMAAAGVNGKFVGAWMFLTVGGPFGLYLKYKDDFTAAGKAEDDGDDPEDAGKSIADMLMPLLVAVWILVGIIDVAMYWKKK